MKPSKPLMTFLMSLVQKRDAQGNKKMSPLRTLFTIMVLGAASYWGFSTDAEAMGYGGWKQLSEDGGIHTFYDVGRTYICPLSRGERKRYGVSTWICDADGKKYQCDVVGPPNHLANCKET